MPRLVTVADVQCGHAPRPTQATHRFKSLLIIDQRQQRQVHPWLPEPASEAVRTAPNRASSLTSRPFSQIWTDLPGTPYEPRKNSRCDVLWNIVLGFHVGLEGSQMLHNRLLTLFLELGETIDPAFVFSTPKRLQEGFRSVLIFGQGNLFPLLVIGLQGSIEVLRIQGSGFSPRHPFLRSLLRLEPLHSLLFPNAHHRHSQRKRATIVQAILSALCPHHGCTKTGSNSVRTQYGKTKKRPTNSVRRLA